MAPWNCLVPHSSSAFFKGVLIANASLLNEGGLNCSAGGDCGAGLEEANALSYSYETCGNIDAFELETGQADYLAGLASRGPIRITIPGNEPPYLITVGPNSSAFVQGTSRRDGSIVRFVTGLLEQFGLDWVEIPISAESRRFSPDSSFTACNHDVALNFTDICAGSVWAFGYRRRITDFTSTLEGVSMHAIVKQQQGTSATFASLVARPFVPFEPYLWLAFVGTLAYAGYALYQLDASGYESEDEADEVGSKVGAEGAEVVAAKGKTRPRKDKLTKSQMKQIKYELDRRRIHTNTYTCIHSHVDTYTYIHIQVRARHQARPLPDGRR